MKPLPADPLAFMTACIRRKAAEKPGPTRMTIYEGDNSPRRNRRITLEALRDELRTAHHEKAARKERKRRKETRHE